MIDSKSKNIIFILPKPLNDFFYKNYISNLIANGFKVSYWNLSKIFNYVGYDDNCTLDIENRNFSCIDIFKNELKKLDDKSIICPQFTHNFYSRKVYGALSKSRCKKIFFGIGYLPTSIISKKSFNEIIDRVLNSRSFIRLFFDSFYMRFLINYERKQLDIVFTSGNVAESIHKETAKKIVSVHHFDVNTYKYNCSEITLEKRYIVFLEENVPHHPDSKNISIYNYQQIDAEKYYNKINSFFDSIEEKFGYEVVIALHPSTNKKDINFQNRKLFCGSTCNLIKNAEFVLIHASTSISYAIINYKPIMFLDSSQYLPSAISSIIHKTSSIVSQPVHEFDNYRTSDLEAPIINKVGYDSYRYKYLTKLPIEVDTNKIIVTELNRIL